MHTLSSKAVSMHYDLKLFVLGDSSARGKEGGGRSGLIAAVRSCLGEGRNAFVLFAEGEPVIENGSIIACAASSRSASGDTACVCTALAVGTHGVTELKPAALYGLEEFHLCILEEQEGRSAFQTALRLMEGNSSCRDIMLITDEGSPSELYSDIRFDRTVCINRMNQESAVRNAVRSIIGPAQDAVGKTPATEEPAAPAEPQERQGKRAVTLPATAQRSSSIFSAPRLARMRKPAVFIAHGLLIIGLVLSVVLPGEIKREDEAPLPLPPAPSTETISPVPLPAPPAPMAPQPAQTVPTHPEPRAVAAEPEAKRQPVRETVAVQTPKVAVGVSVGLITANLRDEGRRVSLSLQLRLTDAKHKEEVVRRMQQINGSFIEYLNYQSAAALISSAGREQMKKHLVARANRVMGREAVKDIAITSFLLKERIRYGASALPFRRQPPFDRRQLSG